MPFDILPAVDLRAGRCVRLYQGDYQRETVHGDDPVAVARRWQQLGAAWLHVVDLDGARAGRPIQLELIGAMAEATGLPMQVGGGLRSLVDVEAAFRAGAARVVLGTAAVGVEAEREFRLDCLERFGTGIVLGLDARDGKLAIRGWTEATRLDAFEFAASLREEGFERIVYTDILRDGALAGPNLEHLGRLAKLDGLRVIASGGISSLEDLAAARRIGAEGAIVGQALYTGAIELSSALAAVAVGRGS